MNSWFLSPAPPAMQNLERVRGAAGADAYNHRASQIKDGRLAGLTAAALYQSLEQPRTLLCQGAWPTRPDFKDVRFTLWQGLMDEASRGRPAVLLYTRAESPAAAAFSSLCHGQELRAGGPAPRGAGLLGGLPADSWLDGLMGAPGSGTEYELEALLELIAHHFARRGEQPTPAGVAGLLRRPAPLLAWCPPPEPGAADPLGVAYNQREALARRLDLLAQENAAGGAGAGQSLYSALRSGASVSWLCTPGMPMTTRLLYQQLLRLDREGVPFTLILDEPRGGGYAPLLGQLSRTRVLCRCDLTPGYPLETGTAPADAFQALLSHFEAVALAEAGQGAALWSAWIGSYQRAGYTANRTSGVNMDLRLVMPGLGWRRDKGQALAYQAHSRMEEEKLRELLGQNGRGLLAGREGAFTLYR
ncbi:MAG: hypothetical protein IIV90_07410 [Oscillospiraceae bacterium]|nr:hypothetical protein [Oscillospiraceae bacterium]